MTFPRQFEELLDFTVASDQMLAERRSYIRYDADRSQYISNLVGRKDKIVIEWKSKGFIVGPTSTLNFDLQLSGDDSRGIGETGTVFRGESAATLFERVRLFASDQVIVDEDFTHRRIDMTDRWSCASDYLFTSGEMQGYDDFGLFAGGKETRFNSDDTNDPNSVNQAIRSVSIPLHHILDFFGQSRLIPAPLIRGSMRLELELLPAVQAVVWGSSPPNANGVMQLDRVRLYMDEMILRTSVMSQLLEAEQTVGIEFPFTSYIGKQFTIPANNPGRIFFDFPESASRAIMFMVRASLVSADTTDGTKSAKLGMNYNDIINSWRVRLGKLYMPTNSDVDKTAQAMATGLLAFNNLASCSRPPAVTLDEFLGTTEKGSSHIMAVTLVREEVSVDGASGELIRFDKGLTFEANVKNFGSAVHFTGYLLIEKLLKLQGGVLLMSS